MVPLEECHVQRNGRKFVNSNHPETLVSSLCNLRTHGVLCDVRLVSGQRCIFAHKIVLAAASPYFSAMFTCGMCESRLDKVEMRDVNVSSLETLVEFAYTGELYVDDLNAQELLETANLLQFKSAIESCGEYIKDRIDNGNCFSVYELGDQLACLELTSAAQQFINVNFSSLILSDGLKTLSFENVMKILSNDGMNIDCEGQIVLACLSWLSHSEENRKELVPELFSVVRLPFICPLELKQFLEICQQKLSTPTFCLVETELQKFKFDATGIQARDSYRNTIHLIGGERSFLSGVREIECYSHEQGHWQQLKPLKKERLSFAAAVLGKKLYLMGGTRKGIKLRTVECFDAETNSWTSVHSLNKCKGDVKAAVIEDKIYTAGGSSDGEPVCRYVEKFDPVSGTWHMVANMKCRRRRFALTALDNHLFALGGFDDNEGDLNSVEHYDPATNRWVLDTPMLSCRYDFGAVVLSNHIYAVGGANGTQGSINTVEKFDPVSNMWIGCSPMKNCRGGLAVTSQFGRIIALSGMSAYMQLLDSAEYYDEVEDEWYEFPATNIPRFGSAAICLPFVMPASKIKRIKSHEGV